MSEPADIARGTRRANVGIAAACLAFVAGMVGMSYAAVPLYAMFCQLTGYGGTTQRVEQYSDRILDRTITVRFDANTAGVPWDFQPAVRATTVRIGETVEARYTATNTFSSPTAGRATFNVTPELAGSYFNKVECFCFTDTTLAPGETLDMPVLFYIDPDIIEVPELKDAGTITLSYTFFPAETPVAAAPQSGSTATTNTTDAKLGG